VKPFVQPQLGGGAPGDDVAVLLGIAIPRARRKVG
jgi:hypothetical protein